MDGKAIASIVAAIVVVVTFGYFVLNRGSDKPPTTPAPQTTEETPPEDTRSNGNTAPQATSSVSIESSSFLPANITVRRGTTVTWTNHGGTVHTVTKDDKKAAGPSSGNISSGDEYSFTFNEVGEFPYHCEVHEGMVGSVTVTE